MANDPVLQRPMFQQGRSAPSVNPSVGLGSMTSPDENAKALRGMFAPTVSLAMPNEMLQRPQQAIDMQPVQSFQEGGFAAPVIPAEPPAEPPVAPAAETTSQTPVGPIPGSVVFRSAERRSQSAAGDALRREGVAAQDTVLANPEAREAMRMMEEGRVLKNRDLYIKGQETLRRLTEEAYVDRKLPSMPPVSPAPPSRGGVGSLDVARMLENDRAQEPRMPTAGIFGTTDKKDEISINTNLDGIRQERIAKEQARTASERRENMLLALMQAGFAMAAGRSPNAISNIGAGGQAGIAAFASMERARREDEALRRRENLQFDIAKMQIDKDPEAIRTYAVLGGWNPKMGPEKYQEAVQKGFQFVQSKEAVKHAMDMLKLAQTDPTLLTEDQKKAYQQLVNSSLTSSFMMGSGNSALPTVRLSANQGQK